MRNRATPGDGPGIWTFRIRGQVLGGQKGGCQSRYLITRAYSSSNVSYSLVPNKHAHTVLIVSIQAWTAFAEIDTERTWRHTNTHAAAALARPRRLEDLDGGSASRPSHVSGERHNASLVDNRKIGTQGATVPKRASCSWRSVGAAPNGWRPIRSRDGIGTCHTQHTQYLEGIGRQ
jgi:hypothetical protein